ncbi:J domain-containing protein [Chitinophaga sp. YIM B06452]|uniref:J domain-containing protein n=1 Tax=Chitinophaga sp. YIM B06452 TaxID=3082158 RepID=UPI0031FEF572
MPTHYQTLGIPETASLQEIKSAFRKLSLRYHPDRNNGDKQSEEIFRGILDAYKVLSDPDQKHWYDQQLYYSRQPRQDHYQSNTGHSYQPPYGQYTYQQNDESWTYTPSPPPVKPWYEKISRWSLVLLLFFFLKMLMFSLNDRKSYIGEFDFKKFDTTKMALTSSTLGKVTYVKLQNGSRILLEDMIGHDLNASVTHSTDDIDNDGQDELRIIITRRNQAQFTDRDIILKRRNSIQDVVVKEPGSQSNSPAYEEFFSHTGGMYIVGNNIRLYFDNMVETYRSCGICNVPRMPYKSNKPGIYLVANKGKLQFSMDYDYRNRILEESLAYLSSRGVPELENGQDDGTRKEYLRQVITYYFNNLDFGKTETLFRKYYTGEDEDVVWEDARSIIRLYAQKITSNAAFSHTEAF